MKVAKVPQGRLNAKMSYVSAYFHCVFATKERRPMITPELQKRLWPYLAGIARENHFKMIEAGGVADHVHLLISLPSTMPISKSIQLLKGGSSKWIHDTFSQHRFFSWQEKYGAFSVSVSQLGVVQKYIQSQPEHHRKKSFEEEFIALLQHHGIEYEEKFLWAA